MSALFGKTDHKKVLRAYIEKGEYEKALKFAVKIGDKFYDEEEMEKAIDTYLLLLELMEGKDVSNHSLYEKLYEKLIPLLFENGQEEEALKYSLLLVNEKVALKKDKEAFDILSALESQFPNSPEIVLKKVELYLSNGDSQSALNSLNNAIASIGPKPKFIELAGEILLNLHKYQDAYDYFNALLAVDPDNEIAKQRISELESALELSKTSLVKIHKENGEIGNVPQVKESVNPGNAEENNTRRVRNVLSELKKETAALSHPVANKNVNAKETTSKINIEKTQEVIPKGKQQKKESKKDFSENEKTSVAVINNNQDDLVDKQKPLLKIVKDPMYVSALQTFLKDEASGYNALLSVAEKYETINPIDAEYIYILSCFLRIHVMVKWHVS
jgi:tetratricopeptide (TPR) repeat protein